MVRAIRFPCLAAVAVSIATMATGAMAQQRHLGAYGPVVLRTDPDSGLPVPGPYREDLRVDRAVPVPTVMNGSAFGLSGTDYYSDGRHEGPLRGGVRTNTYILAPALRIAPSR